MGHDILINIFHSPGRYNNNICLTTSSKHIKLKFTEPQGKTKQRTILFVNINAKILNKILVIEI